MTPTWNRGIGVLLFNTVEENSIENCSDGILLNANNSKLDVEWPRAIGNILRRNTAVGSRGNGIVLNGSSPVRPASVWGTVAEFNMLRDQPTGVSAAEATLGTVVRRNLIYVWDSWLLSRERKGLDLRGEGTAQEFNNLEGSRGEGLR